LCGDIQKYNRTVQEGDDRKKYLELITGIHYLAVSIERKLKRILLWSKLERKKYEVKLTQINLSDYLHEMLPEILGISIQKDVKVRFDINNSIYLDFDRHSLKTILRILVENGVEYSEPGSEIFIRGQKVRSGIIISVTDFGPGIPAGIQDKIFDFNNISSGEVKSDNLGLGLIIAHHLAELNNCYISFESSQSKGTTFYIQIRD